MYEHRRNRSTFGRKGDASWINIELIAQWGDTIYYKNPFREEVYRVNLDGSDNNYVCYADDVEDCGRQTYNFV